MHLESCAEGEDLRNRSPGGINKEDVGLLVTKLKFSQPPGMTDRDKAGWGGVKLVTKKSSKLKKKSRGVGPGAGDAMAAGLNWHTEIHQTGKVLTRGTRRGVGFEWKTTAPRWYHKERGKGVT